MEPTLIWLVILVVGIGTFSLRFSFIYALEKSGDLEALKQILRYVPAAVLSALVVSGLFLREDAFTVGPGGYRLVAGLCAAFIAWKTENILFTIIGGMGILWFLTFIGNMFA